MKASQLMKKICAIALAASKIRTAQILNRL